MKKGQCKKYSMGKTHKHFIQFSLKEKLNNFRKSPEKKNN